MEVIFLVKIIATAAVVVGLSLLAEYVSPKAAGILSGYPTVSAIILFFYGLEVSPEFAARSAEYNIIGISGVLFFVYFYYKASLLFTRYNVVLSSLTAIVGYFIVIWLLHFVDVNKFIAVLFPVGASLLFIFILKGLKDVKIKNKIKTNYKVLFIRSSFAIAVILIVTSIPQLIGERWAGLFSAFPSTIFPLMLIVHITYSREHVYTVIKNVPVGLFSVITYSLMASMVYPIYGIYWGTLISLGAASIYLIIYSKIRNVVTKRRNITKIESLQ